MTLTKRQKSLKDSVNKEKFYDLSEAIDLVKKTATAKFDETVEVHARLGIDPKKNEMLDFFKFKSSKLIYKTIRNEIFG